MRLRSLAALGACLAVPALAETNAECIFQMDRHDVLVGPCLRSEREPSKAFAISSPDGSIAARVASTGGGLGTAYWNGGTAGQPADILIGPVVLVGACWASDKTNLCMTR
ncbi:MAG: hypothetical protein ACK4P8_07560 [Tabrizicola sp.]